MNILHFQDVFMHIHTTNKANTLNTNLLLITTTITSTKLNLITHSITNIIFLVLTSPISTHLLTRTSIITKMKTYKQTRINKLKNKYTPTEQVLKNQD